MILELLNGICPTQTSAEVGPLGYCIGLAEIKGLFVHMMLDLKIGLRLQFTFVTLVVVVRISKLMPGCRTAIF